MKCPRGIAFDDSVDNKITNQTGWCKQSHSRMLLLSWAIISHVIEEIVGDVDDTWTSRKFPLYLCQILYYLNRFNALPPQKAQTCHLPAISLMLTLKGFSGWRPIFSFPSQTFTLLIPIIYHPSRRKFSNSCCNSLATSWVGTCKGARWHIINKTCYENLKDQK